LFIREMIGVQAARERFAGSATSRWRFARADIGAPLEMGNAERACDLATAFDVLFHLVEDQNWNGALDNIARAVKPGGCAVIFDKYQSVENAIGHVRRRTLDAYREALIARGFEIVTVRPIFFLMNSPTDLSGLSKFVFKTAWSLTRLPYKIGRVVGLGEVFGAISGACLYWPELLLGRIFSNGPSTKILVARKK
jgi:SAM-dependent methyltransferase